MTPFQILFGCGPRTSLDTLGPQVDDTEETGGEDNFIKRCRQMMAKLRDILAKIHAKREVRRQTLQANIQRPSPRGRAQKGDLVLVRESESALYRERLSAKLVHERWIGPWLVINVVLQGHAIEVTMHGRKLHRRTVPTSLDKTFPHEIPYEIPHEIPMEDEVAQQIWKSDLGLAAPSWTAAKS